MAVHTFRPAGSSAVGGWTTVGTTVIDAIDDDPDAPNTADYVQQTITTDVAVEVELSDAPADMPLDASTWTAVVIKAYVAVAGLGDDGYYVYAQLKHTLGGTNWTSGSVVNLSTVTSATGQLLSASAFSQLVGAPSGANGLNDISLLLQFLRTAVMGADSGYTWRLYATEVEVTYTVPVAISQAAYRFYADGTQTASVALAAQDTAHSVDVSGGDVNLQLRARLQSTSNEPVPVTDDFQLQWEKNASGTWTNVTIGGTTVVPHASANLTDATATTNRLGAGAGTFVAGRVSEDGLADNQGWSANNFTEVLYSLTLKQANLTNGDTLRFRVLRNAATTGFTYTAVPTINVGTAGPTTHQLAATGNTATTAGSAAMRATRILVATGTGVSAGTAASGLLIPLAATGTGTSTGSAAVDIVRLHLLTATGDGVTSGSAAVDIVEGVETFDLAATGNTASTAGTAAMTATRALAAGGVGATAGTAAVDAVRQIAATGTGTSTGSAAVRHVHTVTSAGTGTTAGSAALGRVHPVTASGTGTSAGSAQFDIVVPTGGDTHQLAATGNTATTGGTAAWTATWSLTSAGAATTAGSAALDLRHQVTATGTGQTAGSAAMTATRMLAATGTGSSAGPAALRHVLAVAAAGTGTSTGTAALGHVHQVTATGTGASAGTGALTRAWPLTSSGTGTTAGSADFNITSGPQNLQLSATGNTASTGGTAAITARHVLAASGAGTTTGTAALTRLLPLTATGTGQTAGTASSTATRTLTAAGAATSTGTANFTARRQLATIGVGATDGTAALSMRRQLTAAGVSTTTGTAAITSYVFVLVHIIGDLSVRVADAERQAHTIDHPRTVTADAAVRLAHTTH